MVWGGEGEGEGEEGWRLQTIVNVSNVKIDTYIVTSRLRSIHLNMI